jgi:hypothetical protein
MDLGISRTRRPGRFCKLGGDLQATLLYCGRDGQERLDLGRQRCGLGVGTRLPD